MADELPVPAQLETQLGKCKTVRSSDFYKARTKTTEVSQAQDVQNEHFIHSTFNRDPLAAISPVEPFQEMEASKSKLPPLPAVTK